MLDVLKSKVMILFAVLVIGVVFVDCSFNNNLEEVQEPTNLVLNSQVFIEILFFLLYNYLGGKMMYLIYGEEEFLIENEVTNIISKSGVDELNISKYDLLSDSLKDIIDDACTVSLFSDKKIVVINNFDNISKLDNKLVDEFDKFIHNISGTYSLQSH